MVASLIFWEALRSVARNASGEAVREILRSFGFWRSNGRTGAGGGVSIGGSIGVTGVSWMGGSTSSSGFGVTDVVVCFQYQKPPPTIRNVKIPIPVGMIQRGSWKEAVGMAGVRRSSLAWAKGSKAGFGGIVLGSGIWIGLTGVASCGGVGEEGSKALTG